MADLLLARRDDHRRARELRVVDRPHGVAEPRCHMHVAGDEPARSAREAVRHRSEEHTSELQSLMRISYAVFCLKNKTNCKPPSTNLIRRSTTPYYKKQITLSNT